jgi:hypothetical protein
LTGCGFSHDAKSKVLDSFLDSFFNLCSLSPTYSDTKSCFLKYRRAAGGTGEVGSEEISIDISAKLGYKPLFIWINQPFYPFVSQ